MPGKITLIAYADDDPDDHFIFSSALYDNFPGIQLKLFDTCGLLMDYMGAPQSPLPELIYLDFNIPGNENHKCLRVIQHSPVFRHIPVVVYSTSSGVQLREEAIANGAHRFICKPVRFEDVAGGLKEVISDLEGVSHDPRRSIAY